MCVLHWKVLVSQTEMCIASIENSVTAGAAIPRPHQWCVSQVGMGREYWTSCFVLAAYWFV